MDKPKLPDWWNADEETFMRHLVSPEEDRSLYGMPPWQGRYRWFRSPNIVCLEKIRKLKASAQVLGSGLLVALALRHKVAAIYQWREVVSGFRVPRQP
jgi:hypothetical protein